MGAQRDLNTQKVALTGHAILTSDHNDDADDVRTAAQAGYDGSTEWPTAAPIGSRFINVVTKRLYHAARALVGAETPPDNAVEYVFQDARTSAAPTHGTDARILDSMREVREDAGYVERFYRQSDSEWRSPGQRHRLVTVTSTPYAVLASDRTIIVDTDTIGGPAAVNLLSLASALDEQMWTIVRYGASAVTVAVSGGGNIHKQSAVVLGGEGQAITVQKASSRYYIVGQVGLTFPAS